MIKFVLPILFSVVCVFAQAKTFNTYAICTAVDDIRYCGGYCATVLLQLHPS